MRIAYAFLADTALGHPDGKMYVLGGGIDTVFSPTFPFMAQPLSMVLKAEFDPEDTDAPHLVEVQLLNSEGSALIPSMKTQVLPQRHSKWPDRAVGVQLVLGLAGLRFERPENCQFRVLLDSEEKVSLPLFVERLDQEPQEAGAGRVV
jgi:hypothetical protein